MKARIILRENVFDSNMELIESGIQLEVEANDKIVTQYYDLTTQEVENLKSDTSGTDEVLKGIAAVQAQGILDNIMAEDDGETIEIDRDNTIDITSML